MELEMVVDDCMTCMIELQQVLECSSSLLVLDFDIMDLDRFDIYRGPGVSSKEAGQAEGIGEGRKS